MDAESAYVSAVVLAAGRGLRMGRTKQLLRVDDRALLAHVVEHALASTVDQVVVVLGHDAVAVRDCLEAYGDTIHIAINRDYASGQASSLRTGLDAVDRRADAAVVLLGDQPGVAAVDIDAVAGAYRDSGGVAIRALYTASHPAVAGHPVVLDRVLWDEVRAIRGDVGAREVLARHSAEVRLVEIPRVAPGDIDTEADLRRFGGK